MSIIHYDFSEKTKEFLSHPNRMRGCKCMSDYFLQSFYYILNTIPNKVKFADLIVKDLEGFQNIPGMEDVEFRVEKESLSNFIMDDWLGGDDKDKYYDDPLLIFTGYKDNIGYDICLYLDEEVESQ